MTLARASGDAPLYPSNNPRRVEFRRKHSSFSFNSLSAEEKERFQMTLETHGGCRNGKQQK
jgi:hypothetical protein